MKNLTFYLKVAFCTIWFIACARLDEGVDNQPPEVIRVYTIDSNIPTNSPITFYSDVFDEEGDSLSATWSSSRGLFLETSVDSAIWVSPDSSTHIRIIYTLFDEFENSDADTVSFWTFNRAPIIDSLSSSHSIALASNTISLSASASDPDSHDVSIFWDSPFGYLHSISGPSIDWTLPDSTMHAWVSVEAKDIYGISTFDTLTVIVYSEIGCAWIINKGEGEIVKLSAEGDELMRMTGFTDLADLDIDPENHRLWVCETDPPAVHAYDLQGNLQFTVNDLLLNPKRLRSRYRTGSVMVIDGDSSTIKELSFNGNFIYRQYNGFSRPNALDINQSTGELWVCDEGVNRLYQIATNDAEFISDVDSSEHVRIHSGFLYPYDVSIEDSTGAIWLADKESDFLVRYDPLAEDSIIVEGFENPVAIDATWSTGLVWVLDRSLNSKAIRIFFDNHQVQVEDLLFPTDIAYNRIDDYCWILETERNRVIRVDPFGNIVGTWGNFDTPTRIVVNTGY
jgi:DNA-binding beta-propeller fold protein YncE